MSKEQIIRAWKDPEYRDSLSEEQRSQLPENPAGIIELSDDNLQAIAGGKLTQGKLCQATKQVTKGVGCKGTKGFSNGFGCTLIGAC